MKGFEEKTHQDDPAAARKRPISRLFRKAIPFVSGTMIAVGAAMPIPAHAFNIIATGGMEKGQAESDSGSVKRSANSSGVAIRMGDNGLFGEIKLEGGTVDRSASINGPSLSITDHELVVQQSAALMAANDTLTLGALNFNLIGIYATATPGGGAGTKDYADMAMFEVTDTSNGEKMGFQVMFNEPCRFVMNGKTYRIEVEGGENADDVYVRALRSEGVKSDASASFETSINDEYLSMGAGVGYKTADLGLFAGAELKSINRRIRNALTVGGDIASAFSNEEDRRLIGAMAKLHYKRLLVSGAIDKEKLSADASFALNRLGILADCMQEKIDYGSIQWKSRTASASLLLRIIRDKDDFVDIGIRQGFEKYTVSTDGEFVDLVGGIRRVSASHSFNSSPTGPIVKFRKGALEGELAAAMYYSKAVRPAVKIKYKW
jgi:hypothetical protein